MNDPTGLLSEAVGVEKNIPVSRFEQRLWVHVNPLIHLIFAVSFCFPHIAVPCFPLLKTTEPNIWPLPFTSNLVVTMGKISKPLWAFSGLFLMCPSDFYQQSKPKDSDKEGTSNSTSEDGPGDGFTILSSKSLVLGQKVIKRIVMCCHKTLLHFYNLLFTSSEASFIPSFPNMTFTLVLNYSFLN